MLNILLSGCMGRMGQTVAKLATEREDLCVVAGIDPFFRENASNKFPVYNSPENFNGHADVIIDFSHPQALDQLLNYAIAHSLPAVICTTGLSDENIEQIKAASQKIPLFFSANMSLGVNLLRALAQRTAQILGNTFDIEIVEAHHNQKLDAPSGTALMLADAIKEVLPETHYVYDRSGVREKRGRNEIGFSAIRGGTIVGEHEIIFAGHSEVIKLSHIAPSKELFASGALSAATYLVGQVPGLYDMRNMM